MAIAYWVRSNAPTWISSGVRVNAVAPGVTRTAMLDDLETSAEAKAMIRRLNASSSSRTSGTTRVRRVAKALIVPTFPP